MMNIYEISIFFWGQLDKKNLTELSTIFLGCKSNGFVMSPSRGTKGEVIWSSCSRRVVQSLDMDCLMENNGVKVTL